MAPLLTSIIFDCLREIAPRKVGLKRCVNTATSASHYLMFIYSFRFLRFPSINITHELCQLKWQFFWLANFRELAANLDVITLLTLTNRFSIILSAFWMISWLRWSTIWIYLPRVFDRTLFFSQLCQTDTNRPNWRKVSFQTSKIRWKREKKSVFAKCLPIILTLS